MKIFVIALNTFREAVRDKILYSLIFFALIMIGLSSIIDRITIGQDYKIIKDFGLGSISIFGVLISIFVGIGLVFKEIDRRTIYSILSKPIDRSEFLLGKYFGLLLTLLVELSIMTFGLFVTLATFSKTAMDWALLKAIVLIFVELSVVTAIALFFSSFSTPFLSGIFTLALFVIGHLTEDLKAFSVRLDEAGQKIVSVIYYGLPNLELFNIKGAVVHGDPVSWSEVFWRGSIGGLWAGFLLVLSMLIFRRREFK